MRIGKRFATKCANIITKDNMSIPWISELKYLGVVFLASQKLKCSFSAAKRKFCIAANAIYAKISMHANEDVVLHLLQTKCLPILLYCVESCPVSKSDAQSLDFIVVRFIMKLFRTSHKPTIDCCLENFGFQLPGELIQTRQSNFVRKTGRRDYALCHLYTWR